MPDVIAANIHMTKINSPEYENMSDEEAVEDFRKRLALYEVTPTLLQHVFDTYLFASDPWVHNS